MMQLEPQLVPGAIEFSDIVDVEAVIQLAIVIAIAYLAQRFIGQVISRLVRRSVRRTSVASDKAEQQREDTLISVLNSVAIIIIWVIAGLLGLGLFDINIGPLLAGAGIAGVALGFGAQSLVKDFLAGIFVLLENQYRVGDVVQVNQGVSGSVQKISLRMTELRDLQGRVHYVPNGEITIATNMTMEFSNVELNIGVGYDADIDQIEAVINRVGEELYADEKWTGVALEPPHMLRVDAFADSSIIIKIVCKTAPSRQWELKGEILRRIKKAFDAEGIAIPYPQLTVHQANSEEPTS